MRVPVVDWGLVISDGRADTTEEVLCWRALLEVADSAP